MCVICDMKGRQKRRWDEVGHPGLPSNEVAVSMEDVWDIPLEPWMGMCGGRIYIYRVHSTTTSDNQYIPTDVTIVNNFSFRDHGILVAGILKLYYIVLNGPLA